MQISYVVEMSVTKCWPHKLAKPNRALNLQTKCAPSITIEHSTGSKHVIQCLFSIAFIIQSMGSRRRLGAFFILFKTASSSPFSYSSLPVSSSSSLPLSLSFLCFFLLPVARLLFVLAPLSLPVVDDRGCCCTVHCASAPSMLFARAARLLRPRVLRPLLESTPARISV